MRFGQPWFSSIRHSAAAGNPSMCGVTETADTFYHGLGVAFSIAGKMPATIGSAPADTSPVDLTIMTDAFGPRYTWTAPMDLHAPP